MVKPHSLNVAKFYQPDIFILDVWGFDNFILAVELFAKSLQRLATCLLISNNLCGKLPLSLKLQIKLDVSLSVIPG